MFHADGRRYEGLWSEGLEHGAGVTYFTDGDRYVGEFDGGKQSASGTYYVASGDRYVGRYENRRRQGHGTYYFSDGGCYAGDFVMGYKQGEGILYGQQGKIVSIGRWQNDGFIETAAMDAEARQKSKQKIRQQSGGLCIRPEPGAPAVG